MGSFLSFRFICAEAFRLPFGRHLSSLPIPIKFSSITWDDQLVSHLLRNTSTHSRISFPCRSHSDFSPASDILKLNCSQIRHSSHKGAMIFISHLLKRLGNSSNASLARTADWISSQSIFGTSSESGSSCNHDTRGNPTSGGRQSRQSAGSNLQIDHLFNSTYRSTNMTPVAVANEEVSVLEDGMCFAMVFQFCETPTPAEQILAWNQNLCGLRIMRGYPENGEEGVWSSVPSDDVGDENRGFVKRKLKRILRFCGRLYRCLARRWFSVSDKSVSKV